MGAWWISLALAAPRVVEISPDGVWVDRPDGPAPIVNGQVEEEHPAAVGLGALGLTLCTGSLIAPRVVLTAAHCGADLPPELISLVGRAYVGTEASTSVELELGAMAVHPDYVELSNTPGRVTLGAYDIAVITLPEDAPVAPVWFREAPLLDDEAVGATVLSVGWGDDGFGASGTKRSAELVVAALDEMFVVSRASENPGGTSICSGDSGGPQYGWAADGTLEQWAVHSWGSVGCRDESGSTRTDVVADWILDQVEAEHGSRERCGAWGLYSDGVCDADCPQPDPDCGPERPWRVSGAVAGESSSAGCASASAGWWLGVFGLLARRRQSGQRTSPTQR